MQVNSSVQIVDVFVWKATQVYCVKQTWMTVLMNHVSMEAYVLMMLPPSSVSASLVGQVIMSCISSNSHLHVLFCSLYSFKSILVLVCYLFFPFITVLPPSFYDSDDLLWSNSFSFLGIQIL